MMLHESLLASVPTFEPLLTTTCSLYTQYAFGFVAAEAEALQRDDYNRSKQLDDRAFKLAERGRKYCWRGLEAQFRGISEALKRDPARALQHAKKEHVALLYWSAAALGAAISTGGIEHPELLIDWPIVRALAERALALDETWNNGSIPELMVTVESQGDALGGSEQRARRYFAVQSRSTRSVASATSRWQSAGQATEPDEFTRLLGQAWRSIRKDPSHAWSRSSRTARPASARAHRDFFLEPARALNHGGLTMFGRFLIDSSPLVIAATVLPACIPSNPPGDARDKTLPDERARPGSRVGENYRQARTPHGLCRHDSERVVGHRADGRRRPSGRHADGCGSS